MGNAAQFNSPLSVAVDPAGNVYVADGGGTIRKITPAGVVSTLAGNPNSVGEDQADGIGLSAHFIGIGGIGMDAEGTLYVTDGAVIRQVTSPAPVISGAATASTSFGENFSYAITDHIFATYDSSALPDGLSLNAATGLITGTASTPGHYTITLSATNAGGTATASFTLTVRPTFAYFRSQNFTVCQLADATVSGPTASPAHDGMGNLLKYAFGLAATQQVTSGAWPASGTSGGRLTLTFVRRNDIADLNYVVEVSADLQTWNSGPDFTAEISATPLDATRDLVTVRDLSPMTGTGRRFIRLRVEQPSGAE
ncbi:MAG: putative Ig domain-containing protein [Verrucomicrobiota bacterium]